MEIKTLGNVQPAEIAVTFNHAFSDYAIPLQFSAQTILAKIAVENIQLQFSPGLFANGKLVAFILNATDVIDGRKTVFNAGTGVIPEFRGQRIAERLYQFILPELAGQGYLHHQLEVLKENVKARRAYEKVGFAVTRELISFRGVCKSYENSRIVTRSLDEIDWPLVRGFRSVAPTWQNNDQCVERTKAQLIFAGAFLDHELAGFAAFDPVSGRVKQFGVKPEVRGRGVGTALFHYISGQVGELNFINYDTSDEKSIAFFRHLGLQPGVELFEMKMVAGD